jgi:hypothetical protein
LVEQVNGFCEVERVGVGLPVERTGEGPFQKKVDWFCQVDVIGAVQSDGLPPLSPWRRKGAFELDLSPVTFGVSVIYSFCNYLKGVRRPSAQQRVKGLSEGGQQVIATALDRVPAFV